MPGKGLSMLFSIVLGHLTPSQVWVVFIGVLIIGDVLSLSSNTYTQVSALVSNLMSQFRKAKFLADQDQS